MSMKKKEVKKRPNKVVETVKTFLLALLVITLVLLVALYISGIRGFEKRAAEGADEGFNKLWSAQGGVEPYGLESSHLIPEFVGYKQASFDKPRGCVGNTGDTSALYDLVKPCILELFGSNSVCSALDHTAGKELFRTAQLGDEFIYIRYHVPVMYQMIYAYSAGKLTVAEDEVAVGASGPVGAYVSELIIVSDKSLGAKLTVAYAHDADGNYYEFRPKEYTAESSFYISKLANNDDGITTCDFSFLHSDTFDGAEPMIDAELLCGDIVPSVVSLNDEMLRDALLRLLGYNPNKLDAYDDKGADVYIDSHSQLRLGGGSVSFVTADATMGEYEELRGIAVDTLLGYTLDSAPTLFDKLTAADNLIRRLGEISPSLIGGEASLCLGDVYRDGELLVVEYFPTYNNIRIGTNVQLRVVFAKNTVCEFELFPVTVDIGETETLVPRPYFIADQMVGVGLIAEDAPADSLRLCYTGGSAEWSAVMKND